MTYRLPAAFVGLSPAQLAANLTAAQAALQALSTGAKVVTASYSQSDGSRSVTYRETDLGTLQQYVDQLARIVYPGQGYGQRRPMRLRFL